MDQYANAVRAEPGICWRMVSRQGWWKGSPMDARSQGGTLTP